MISIKTAISSGSKFIDTCPEREANIVEYTIKNWKEFDKLEDVKNEHEAILIGKLSPMFIPKSSTVGRHLS